jgi:hypothetical protein
LGAVEGPRGSSSFAGPLIEPTAARTSSSESRPRATLPVLAGFEAAAVDFDPVDFAFDDAEPVW